MRTTWLLLTCSLLLLASPIAAEPYPATMAQRPLVLNQGMFQAGADVDLGMNKDRALKDLGVGLSIAYGVTKDLELGLDVGALSYGKDAQGAKLGGATIYGRYRFIEMLAAQLDIYFPGDHGYLDSFGDQLIGVTLGLPFQYIAVENMLKIHAMLGFDAAFVKDTYATSGGESPQMNVLVGYGVTYNPMQALFLDLSSGTILGLKPSAGSMGDRAAMPLAFTVGGTLLDGSMDVYVALRVANLKPPAGGAFDTKSIGVGALYRF